MYMYIYIYIYVWYIIHGIQYMIYSLPRECQISYQISDIGNILVRRGGIRPRRPTEQGWRTAHGGLRMFISFAFVKVV